MPSRKPAPVPKPSLSQKWQPNYKLVAELQALGYQKIVGVDEVGRGALAGPLVVAAVELPVTIAGVTDSKLLPAEDRRTLAEQIHHHSRQKRLGIVSAQEIDTLGLAAATALAYTRALEFIEADIILTDFVRLPGRKFISQPKGDRYFYPVAAASIVAKVYRDQLMTVYHQARPQYGWARNVGYGTVAHKHALALHGHCDLHRLTFL